MQAFSRVNICGIDTSKLPKLSAKETMRLITEIKNGNESAKEEFIYANLRLVLSVVQRFMHRGATADDLFQVGCLGLIKAVKNFDLSHNVQFSTYAVPMIIGEIRRFLRDDNSMRVSRSMRDLAYKAMALKEKMLAQKGANVTNAELAKELEVPVSLVDAALEATQEPISIFEPVFRDGNDTLYVQDQISDGATSEEKWSEKIALQEALTKLDKREYNIINMRYFLGKTQMEIAEEIGISQAQVSRLEKGALERMRKYM